MGILNIAPASRSGAHLLFNLFGAPETGKTFSALLLGRGIAGRQGIVGMLDTEAGRGTLYDDQIPNGYLHADLEPPFTATRYVEAINEWEAVGCQVLIIDSFSHAWQGEGGVLEQADNSKSNDARQKWRDPKRAYSKVTNKLLSTKMHIILCSRASQPLIDGPVVDGKKTMVRGPWKPIQDKMIRYDMTVVMEMTGQGKFRLDKCPGPIRHLFPADSVADTKMGEGVGAWVAGKAVDWAIEALKNAARNEAETGSDTLLLWWDRQGKEDKAKLKPFLENYKSIARAADAEQQRQLQEQRDASGLDDPFPSGDGKVVSIGAAAAPATPPADLLGDPPQRPFWDGDLVIPSPPAGDKNAEAWNAWLGRIRVRIEEAGTPTTLEELRQANLLADAKLAAMKELSAISTVLKALFADRKKAFHPLPEGV